MKNISKNEAHSLIVDILTKQGTLLNSAQCVADALISADIDGHAGHGISRVLAYAACVKVKKVNGKAQAKIVDRTSSALRIDAEDGFAFPALSLAITELCKMTPKSGIAAVSIFNSHHFGSAGYHVEQLAKQGYVALLFGNAPKAMSPWGGKKALFGTNPIAFAAPRKSHDPLVIDMSLSKVARGNVILAKQKNESIPEGWALDKHGKATTNPDEAIEGSMLPMGEAKGASLALMIEILAAALTASNFGFEASSFIDDKGKPSKVGQLLIAFDVNFFSQGTFLDRIEELINEMLQQEGVRLPGSKRLDSRRKSKDTLCISSKLYDDIKAMIKE